MERLFVKTNYTPYMLQRVGGFLNNQRGTAMFVALMMLSLGTGLGLLAFQVSSTELMISNYSEYELASTYLAESGVEQVLSWVSHPERSPNEDFFRKLPTTDCSNPNGEVDFSLFSSDLDDAKWPFSALEELEEMGKIDYIRLYKPLHADGICTVEVRSVSKKGAVKTVRVELTRSPMWPMTAGVQGMGNPAIASPVWVHWGGIRYTGEAHLGSSVDRIPALNPDPPSAIRYQDDTVNEDPWMEIHVEEKISKPSPPDNNGSTPFNDRDNVYQKESDVVLDTFDLNEIKRIVMEYGEYYVVSPDGHLEQNGVDKGTFDEIFPPGASEYRLVWIDVDPDSSTSPITLEGGDYKGYFYFSGDVIIEGNQAGKIVEAASPPWPTPTSPPQPVSLNNVNLDGLLYVQGEIDLNGPFSVYGAVFAGQGFSGDGAGHLEVWYNNDFRSATYSGLPSIVLLKGTWRTLSMPDV
ncbi:MAG: hypothetical protein ACE5HN_05065 [Nitrospiria bacterium]